MKVLIPNIGSTSFKYRVLEVAEFAGPEGQPSVGQADKVLAQGRMERIGQPGGECADYPAAIRKCIGGDCRAGEGVDESLRKSARSGSRRCIPGR